MRRTWVFLLEYPEWQTIHRMDIYGFMFKEIFLRLCKSENGNKLIFICHRFVHYALPWLSKHRNYDLLKLVCVNIWNSMSIPFVLIYFRRQFGRGTYVCPDIWNFLILHLSLRYLTCVCACVRVVDAYVDFTTLFCNKSETNQRLQYSEKYYGFLVQSCLTEHKNYWCTMIIERRLA